LKPDIAFFKNPHWQQSFKAVFCLKRKIQQKSRPKGGIRKQSTSLLL